MARDRQQAKQRQAERRARRLAQQEGDGKRAACQPLRETSERRRTRRCIDPDLAAGAPPQDEGRSDGVVDDEPDFDDDEDEHLTEEEVEAEEEAEARARRPRRGGLRGARPPRRRPSRGTQEPARVSYSS